MANKTYRCLTCGFALTCDETDDLATVNRSNHQYSLQGIEDGTACPACHAYLKKHGGRKYGRVQMPDIKTAGKLEDESNPGVLAKRQALDKDFHDLNANRGAGNLTALRAKYSGNKKIYSFSVDDLIAQHDNNKQD